MISLPPLTRIYGFFIFSLYKTHEEIVFRQFTTRKHIIYICCDSLQ